MAAARVLLAAARSLERSGAAASSARGYGELASLGLKSKGPPGRHAVSGVTATVFGATGFLGRYVVNQLAKVGSQVVLPTRCNDMDYSHLKVMGDLGQIVQQPEFSIRDEGAIAAAVRGSNVVINLLGKSYETMNYGFDEANAKSAGAIAAACAAAGVEKLVHVSCLGADAASPSAYNRAKAAGEAAALEAFPAATIVRPAHMFGTEDKLLGEIARVTLALPFYPLWDGGDQKLQPVNVHDVAIAMSAIATDRDSASKVFTLAGTKVYKMKELVELVHATIKEDPTVVSLPLALGKLAAQPREVLRARGLPIPMISEMLTLDYLERCDTDVVAPADAVDGFAAYGITPRAMEGYNIDYLRTYRSGGYTMGTTAGSS